MAKKILKPVELDLDAPGKDLSRLFASSLSTTPDVRRATMIPVERLLDNPHQPRTRGNEDALEELAQVIREQGFQGVLVAREHPDRGGYYQITAGHRRREASKRAGLSELPVVVEDLDDRIMAEIAITENIQREDLSSLDEARIYLLMKETWGYTLELMASKLGKTTGYIYNRLRVARAPEDIQALVEAKPDSLRAVANLIQVESAEARAPIVQALLAGTLTTDDLPYYIRNLHQGDRSSAVLSGGITGSGGADAGGGDVPAEATSLPGVPDGQGLQHVTSAAPLSPASRLSVERGASDHIEGVTVTVNGVPLALDRHASQPNTLRPVPGPRSGGQQLDLIDVAAHQRRRVRHSKVERVLALLRALDTELPDRAELSEGERCDLASIAVLSARLCARLNIDPDAPAAH